jgi:siroheme synthase-like protein
VLWLTRRDLRVPLDLDGALRKLELRNATFEAGLLDGIWLAILADRDELLAKAMFDACEAQQRLFCAIDQPPYYNFSHMALVECGPVVIAIGTAGRAPALARRLQVEFKRLLGPKRVRDYFESIAALRTRTPSSLRKTVLEAALLGFRIQGDVELPDSVENPAAAHSNAGKPADGSGGG